MSVSARRLARDPQRSCLVQAPAGAGKTELLTQRILALLAIVDEPEEILALTFTRKAAAEMRRRVIEALSAVRPEDEDSAHKMETWQLAQQALARSDERAWHLMQHPARLRMMTLDSLTHSLARQLPLLSGLGAMPKPSDDAGRLYREAAEAALHETMRIFPDAAAAVLLHQDHQAVAVIQLLADMLGKREQWLEEVVTHARDMASLRGMLENNLAAIMAEQLHACDQLVPVGVKAELPALMRFAAEHLVHAQPANETLQSVAAWPQPILEELPVWKLMADFLLLKNEAGFRKSVNKGQGFPAGKEFAGQKAQCVDMLAELADNQSLAEALHGLRLLPDSPAMADSQWQVLESLFTLLALSNKHLHAVFAAQGAADFTEIALRAMQALGTDGENPADLLLKMDYRIRHILVDEFQDTSLLQLRLLQQLTAGWQEGDGIHRSLFMVGDPMQSIYRFRKAEVGLFLKAASNEANLPQVMALNLERNFRSSPVIVDWVNRAFRAIFPSHQNSTSGAVAHAPAVAALKHAGAVKLHLQTGRDALQEAQAVVELVRQELAAPAARGGDQRIGILARSRKHLHAILPALTRADIAFRAINILPLNARPEVRLLRALLRALLHPADREAWAAILRAPCCGMDTRDLHVLMAGDDRPMWVIMSDMGKCEDLSIDGRQRVSFVQQALAPCMAVSGKVAVRVLLSSAWLRLGMDGLVDETSNQNIEAALELIESLDEAGRVNFSTLDERLKDLFAAPESSEQAARVELMTMHGAKGLQWDVVILPGLGLGGGKGDTPMLAFTEVPAGHGAIPLMAVRGATRQPDAFYSLVQRVEKAKYDNELQRLLYVACTRAESNLHMLGHVSDKEQAVRGSLLHLLLGKGADCFGAEVGQIEATEAADHQRRLPLMRVAKIPMIPVLEKDIGEEGETEYAWAGAEAAPVGNAVHAAMQHVGEKGIEQWSEKDSAGEVVRMRRMLMADGLSGDLLDAALARCSDGLNRVLASEKGSWILSGKHNDAHCEWALSTMLHGGILHKVIDRSFVDSEGVRWVVDYKTASHEGGGLDAFLSNEEDRHRPQLLGYVQILHRMEPEREIKAALYFPLLDAWREIHFL